MDISELTPSENTVEIKHPATDEKLGVRVTIMSPDDERMKAIKRKVTDFNIQKQKRGKTLNAVEIENNENALIIATMTGWEWYGKDDKGEDVSFEGKKPNFNPKNINAVFKKLPWFKAQVSEVLDDEKGFFQNSN